VGAPEGFQEQAGEILRQASIALGGRTVTLYEVSPEPSLVPQVSSNPHPRHHDTKVDLDATLRLWGVPIQLGSRWVGTRLGDDGPWLIAPVRTQPPAPPPGGRERRSPERLTLELAGLCVGLVDRREPATWSPPSLSPFRGAGDLDPQRDLVLLPGVIAHEARNPLTAARAGLQLIVESVGKMADLGADRRLELLGELADVGEAIDRALDFLRAVSDRARGIQRGRTRFDLVRAVRSCVELERRLLAQRGVTLELTTALESTYVVGDPSLLYELLLNLIRNAADASAARRTPVRVELTQEGDASVLSVRDEGPGIPSHLHQRIFEPGFTTKVEGTGTGLAIVRTVAEKEFAGTVRVVSASGAGAAFIVTLPTPAQRGVRSPELGEPAPGPI
jgi:signal transduction histidine kinase